MSTNNSIVTARKLSSAQSLAASFQTDPVLMQTVDNLGLWIYASSVTDNTGVFTVQIRPYKDAAEFGDWVSLSTTYTLANAAASFYRNELSMPLCQFRVSFVAAGSTPDGSVDIWYSAKGS